jgi:hypothetical protein
MPLESAIDANLHQWSEFVAADDPEAQALTKHAADMGRSEDGGEVDD